MSLKNRDHMDDKKVESSQGDIQEFNDDRNNSFFTKEGTIINPSGHQDQLKRQYGLWSICGLALSIDNAWIAFGGTLSIAIFNGGPPGIIYEFITSCVYYAFIGASIAELASSVASSGGIYHWASITPGARYGRIVGFFAGSLNFFGWVFALASILYIPANVSVQMYALFHPSLEIQPWHAYVAYLLVLWLSTAVVVFCNGLIPRLQNAGILLIIVGGLVTIIVLAAMPSKHATNAFVWRDFVNTTGWSDGVAFLTGVLNGAFTIGTPDAITKLAEELPNPRVDLPRAVFAQIGLGFLTTFVFAIALLYGISDLSAATHSNGSFPLAAVYAQATGSRAATLGLLLIILLSILICCIGTNLMVGRLWWTLARDNATPFSKFFSVVNERLSCPVRSTVLCAVLCTAFGAIPLGNETAFTNLVGSFIVLTTASYFLAIFPNILTRKRNVPKGPFNMGSMGYVVNGIACVLIVFFNIFFCFPYGYPVKPISLMNWNSVILVGVIVLTIFWWLVHGLRRYPGPKLAEIYIGNN